MAIPLHFTTPFHFSFLTFALSPHFFSLTLRRFPVLVMSTVKSAPRKGGKSWTISQEEPKTFISTSSMCGRGCKLKWARGKWGLGSSGKLTIKVWKVLGGCRRRVRREREKSSKVTFVSRRRKVLEFVENYYYYYLILNKMYYFVGK